MAGTSCTGNPTAATSSARKSGGATHRALEAPGLARIAPADRPYVRMAADHLHDALSDEFTQSLLRKTYGATQGEVDAASPAQTGPSRRC